MFWNSAVNAEVKANMPQFYADAAISPWFDLLSEYATTGSTPNQSIGRGTSTAGVTLVPSRCATSSNCSMSDAQLQTELAAQINGGALPAPSSDGAGNPNTIYMVHFPANVSLSGPDGSGTSCVQFCAYHNTGTFNSKPLLYGVVMDHYTSACSSGCGVNATSLENTTSTASHELAESVTDPDIGLDTQSDYAFPAAWADNSNECGEVADICDADAPGYTITEGARSWIVQQLWSNAKNACVGTGLFPHYTVTAPATASPGTAFAFTVTVKNPAGNLATDIAYVGTVHFTSSDAAAVLPSDFTFVPEDQGVASLNATLDTIGSQTITAVDTLNGNIVATSNSVTVSEAATTTTLSTVCPTTFVENQSITLTAAISGFNPTGTVSFADNPMVFCDSTLASGAASCQTPPLTLQASGTSYVYSVVADYGGDGENLGSSSTPLTLTVLLASDVLFRGGFDASIPGCPTH